MGKLVLVLTSLVACGLVGWTFYRQIQPEPTSVSLGEEPEEITLLCTETGKVSRGEWQTLPAVNPATGRRTLVQGLFCETCHKWYPAPPPEMASQSPRGPACPKDGSPLAIDGPLP